ncbi:unnamed protein product, partial [Amoebophrya sp. A120]
ARCSVLCGRATPGPGMVGRLVHSVATCANPGRRPTDFAERTQLPASQVLEWAERFIWGPLRVSRFRRACRRPASVPPQNGRAARAFRGRD